MIKHNIIKKGFILGEILNNKAASFGGSLIIKTILLNAIMVDYTLSRFDNESPMIRN